MSPTKHKINLEFTGGHSIAELLGDRDELIKMIERKYNVGIFILGDDVEVSGKGKNVKEVTELIKELVMQVNMGQTINREKVSDSIKIIETSTDIKPHQVFSDSILVNSGKKIKPRTEGQKKYIDSIKQNTIVFGIGPAGTGKTYLALATAVEALKQDRIARIILVKPVVEAGEKLGFLPGDIYDKVNPYLRPLYDALYEMLDIEKFQQYRDMGIIEVVPLAYMRGRTLNDSFILLDEAQNASPEQMKMFLTRLGFGSKMVITGDITQVDLPSDRQSGLILMRSILDNVEGIDFINLTSKDVVRHELVQKIVDAYREFDERTKR